MFETDNVDVKLKPERSKFGQREDSIRLKQLVAWLKARNIKYSFVYYPGWRTDYPYAIKMRKEDALIFKLVHNL